MAANELRKKMTLDVGVAADEASINALAAKLSKRFKDIEDNSKITINTENVKGLERLLSIFQKLDSELTDVKKSGRDVKAVLESAFGNALSKDVNTAIRDFSRLGEQTSHFINRINNIGKNINAKEALYEITSLAGDLNKAFESVGLGQAINFEDWEFKNAQERLDDLLNATLKFTSAWSEGLLQMGHMTSGVESSMKEVASGAEKAAKSVDKIGKNSGIKQLNKELDDAKKRLDRFSEAYKNFTTFEGVDAMLTGVKDSELEGHLTKVKHEYEEALKGYAQYTRGVKEGTATAEQGRKALERLAVAANEVLKINNSRAYNKVNNKQLKQWYQASGDSDKKQWAAVERAIKQGGSGVQDALKQNVIRLEQQVEVDVQPKVDGDTKGKVKKAVDDAIPDKVEANANVTLDGTIEFDKLKKMLQDLFPDVNFDEQFKEMFTEVKAGAESAEDAFKRFLQTAKQLQDTPKPKAESQPDGAKESIDVYDKILDKLKAIKAERSKLQEEPEPSEAVGMMEYALSHDILANGIDSAKDAVDELLQSYHELNKQIKLTEKGSAERDGLSQKIEETRQKIAGLITFIESHGGVVEDLFNGQQLKTLNAKSFGLDALKSEYAAWDEELTKVLRANGLVKDSMAEMRDEVFAIMKELNVSGDQWNTVLKRLFDLSYDGTGADNLEKLAREISGILDGSIVPDITKLKTKLNELYPGEDLSSKYMLLFDKVTEGTTTVENALKQINFDKFKEGLRELYPNENLQNRYQELFKAVQSGAKQAADAIEDIKQKEEELARQQKKADADKQKTATRTGTGTGSGSGGSGGGSGSGSGTGTGTGSGSSDNAPWARETTLKTTNTKLEGIDGKIDGIIKAVEKDDPKKKVEEEKDKAEEKTALEMQKKMKHLEGMNKVLQDEISGLKAKMKDDEPKKKVDVDGEDGEGQLVKTLSSINETLGRLNGTLKASDDPENKKSITIDGMESITGDINSILGVLKGEDGNESKLNATLGSIDGALSTLNATLKTPDEQKVAKPIVVEGISDISGNVGNILGILKGDEESSLSKQATQALLEASKAINRLVGDDDNKNALKDAQKKKQEPKAPERHDDAFDDEREAEKEAVKLVNDFAQSGTKIFTTLQKDGTVAFNTMKEAGNVITKISGVVTKKGIDDESLRFKTHVSGDTQAELARQHNQIAFGGIDANDSQLQKYNAEYAKLIQIADVYANQQDALSEEQIANWNNQIKLVRDLGNTLMNVMKKQGLFDVDLVKENSTKQLDAFEKKMEKAGINSNELKTKVAELRTEIGSIKDADGIDKFTKGLSELELKYDKAIAAQKEFKSILGTFEKAEKIRFQMIGLDEADADFANLQRRYNALMDDVNTRSAAFAHPDFDLNAGKTKKTNEVFSSGMNKHSSALNKLVADAKNAGVYTEELENKVAALNTRLKSLNGADQFDAWIADMNRLQSEYEQTIAAQKELDDIVQLRKNIGSKQAKLYSSKLTDVERTNLHAELDGLLQEDEARTLKLGLNNKAILEAINASERLSASMRDVEKAANIDLVKESSTKQLNDFVEKMQKAGVYGKELQSKVSDLRKEISNMSDVGSFEKFINNFEELKLDYEIAIDKQKEFNNTIELFKKAETLRFEMIGLDETSAKFAGLKQEYDRLMKEFNRRSQALGTGQFDTSSETAKFTAGMLNSRISAQYDGLDKFVEGAKKAGLYTDSLKQRVDELLSRLIKVQGVGQFESWIADMNKLQGEYDQTIAAQKELNELVQLRQNIGKKQVEMRSNTLPDEQKRGVQAEIDSMMKEYQGRAQKFMMLDSSILDAIGALSKLSAAVTEVDQKIAKADARSKTAFSGFANKFDDISRGYQKLNDSVKGFNFDTDQADDLQKYQEAYKKLIDLKQKFEAKGKADLTDADRSEWKSAVEDLNKYEKKIKDVVKASEKLRSSAASKDDILDIDKSVINDLERLKSEMTDFARGFGELSDIRFDDELKVLSATAKDSSGAIRQVQVALDSVNPAFVRSATAAKQTQSSWGKFMSSMKNKTREMAAYFMTFGSFYDIINVVRNGVISVKEIDDALVELKKVTDETEASYNRFLQTMSQTGSKIGATVKDLTTSAADWARLKYLGPLYGDI